MRWQNTWSAKTGPILIAAISARALTQAARRCGAQPLAVDFFGDADLRIAASAWRKLSDPIDGGFLEDSLIGALDALCASAGEDPVGIVCGSGFEDRPELLEKIAERWPLIGNGAAIIARVKDPVSFFGALDKLAIPYPEFCLTVPDCPDGWLFKKRGGAGGGHIICAAEGQEGLGYFQKRMGGVAVSALVLGNGADAQILGCSEQWTAPDDAHSMRYGGSIQPARLEKHVGDALEIVSKKIAVEFSLKGLASIDFLVSGDGFHVLEVNARPGATLDIFDGPGMDLFGLHVGAANGVLPKVVPGSGGASASAVVYAPRDLVIPADMGWPSWVFDRPNGGEIIKRQTPLCTVMARDRSFGVTKNLVAQYSQDVQNAISAT